MIAPSFLFQNLGKGLKILLSISLGSFIIQKLFSFWYVEMFAFSPILFWSKFFLWQPISYMFIHIGFFHFLFNMFALWMFGKDLESLWGTTEFIQFYLFCGFFSAMINILITPFSTIPILGASGGIYGLILAYALYFPNSIIYLYGVFPVSSRQFCIIIGLLSFFSSISVHGSSVSHLSHLGGILGGYLYLKNDVIRSVCGYLYEFFKNQSYKIKQLIKKSHKEKKTDLHVVPSEDLHQKVDKVLEKVLLHGAKSLTTEEKILMQKYSSKKYEK